MTNEEKIFDILAAMQQNMQTMQGDIVSMKGDIASMHVKIDTVIEPRLDALDRAVLKTNFKIETDIETKLDTLADGHEAITEMLIPRCRVDDLENEVRFLKSVVFRLNDDIAELKKAQ